MAFFSLCFFLSRNRKEKIMFLFIFQSIRRLFDGYYCQQEHEQISQKKCDLFVSGSGDEREQTKANNFKLNLSNFHATKMMWNLLRADLWHSIFFNPLQFPRNMPDTSIPATLPIVVQAICSLLSEYFRNLWYKFDSWHKHYSRRDNKNATSKSLPTSQPSGPHVRATNTTKNAVAAFQFVNVSLFFFYRD